MVRLNVRDHADARGVVEEGTVGFVGLGHENRAGAMGRVDAQGGHVTADGEGRVHSGTPQHDGDHGGGGGLAVGSCHGHQVLLPHRSGQCHRAVDDPQVPPPRLGQFRVLLADRGGDHHGVGIGHVGSVMSHEGPGSQGTQGTQARRVLGIGAGHGDALGNKHPGDGGHARAAETDEVHLSQVGRL